MNYESMNCDFYVEVSEDLVPKIYVQYTVLSVEEIQLIIGAKVLSKWSNEHILPHSHNSYFRPPASGDQSHRS
jgi:hypothetical protein